MPSVGMLSGYVMHAAMVSGSKGPASIDEPASWPQAEHSAGWTVDPQAKEPSSRANQPEKRTQEREKSACLRLFAERFIGVLEPAKRSVLAVEDATFGDLVAFIVVEDDLIVQDAVSGFGVRWFACAKVLDEQVEFVDALVVEDDDLALGGLVGTYKGAPFLVFCVERLFSDQATKPNT